MKILLINPPSYETIQSCMPKILEEGLDYLPPLGLMYVAAFIEKNTNHEVEILDAQVELIDLATVKEEIRRRRPDVIGVTVMTFTLLGVIQTVKAAKEVNPGVKIILSGPHVIIYPEEIMQKLTFLFWEKGKQPSGHC